MYYKNKLSVLLLFLLFVFSGKAVFAQIDTRSGNLKIPAMEDSSKIKTPTPEANKSREIPSMKAIEDLSEEPLPALPNPLEKQRNPIFFMQDQEQFADAGAKYTREMNRRQNYSEDEKNEPGNQEDQDLGTYKSGSKFVKIQCRDFSYVDGDKVAVLVNDKIVQSLVTLRGSFSGFNLELEPGFNKISFKALNQGTSGPNTAEFVIYDDTGSVIVSNQWNLLTGVEAKLVIVKEE